MVCTPTSEVLARMFFAYPTGGPHWFGWLNVSRSSCGSDSRTSQTAQLGFSFWISATLMPLPKYKFLILLISPITCWQNLPRFIVSETGGVASSGLGCPASAADGLTTWLAAASIGSIDTSTIFLRRAQLLPTILPRTPLALSSSD